MTQIRDSLIRRVKAWAAECAEGNRIDRAYLFGSLVFDGGSQFDPQVSDVDLIVRFAETCSSPLDRLAALAEITAKNETLEIDLLRILKRRDAFKPIVSTTPVTTFELSFGVHKGGRPALYSHSQFLDLLADDTTITNLSRTSTVPYGDFPSATAALEGAQGVRNQYVAVSANATRFLNAWTDEHDPLPKSMARAAAQFRYYRDNLSDDSCFDLNRGYTVISELVSAREGEAPEYRDLQRWLDINRGRGIRKPLEPRSAMLLWEILAATAEQLLRSRLEYKENTVTNLQPAHTAPDGRPSSPPLGYREQRQESPPEILNPHYLPTKETAKEQTADAGKAHASDLDEKAIYARMKQLEARVNSFQSTPPDAQIFFENRAAEILIRYKNNRIFVPKSLKKPKEIKDRLPKVNHAHDSNEAQREAKKPQGVTEHIIAAMKKSVAKGDEERKQSINLYNSCLDKYFAAYEVYYEKAVAYYACKKYPIILDLWIENSGGSVANDLDIEIEFPNNGFSVVNSQEFPSPPRPPNPPESFYGSNRSEVIAKYRHYDPNSVGFLEEVIGKAFNAKADSGISQFRIQNTPFPKAHCRIELLKHYRPIALPSLRLLYHQRNFMSFDFRYSIFVSNIPKPVMGSLNVLFD